MMRERRTRPCWRIRGPRPRRWRYSTITFASWIAGRLRPLESAVISPSLGSGHAAFVEASRLHPRAPFRRSGAGGGFVGIADRASGFSTGNRRARARPLTSTARELHHPCALYAMLARRFPLMAGSGAPDVDAEAVGRASPQARRGTGMSMMSEEEDAAVLA